MNASEELKGENKTQQMEPFITLKTMLHLRMIKNLWRDWWIILEASHLRRI